MNFEAGLFALLVSGCMIGCVITYLEKELLFFLYFNEECNNILLKAGYFLLYK